MDAKRSLILVTGLLFLAAGSAVAYVAVPVGHLRAGSPGAGSFDFGGTEYERVPGNCTGNAPPVTGWVLGTGWSKDHPASNAPCFEAFQNAVLDLGLSGYTDAEWVLVDWNFDLYGWPFLTGPESVAVETSFVDGARENTPQHRSFYAVAAIKGCESLDLGNVTNGLGPSGNRVPVREIPVPSVTGYRYARDAVLIDVSVQDPESYTDGQATDPVTGQRVLYVLLASGEPLTSDPAFYQDVRDPVSPGSPFGEIPKGTTNVTVAVPYPTTFPGNIYLVSVVCYYGGSTSLCSAGTSGHSSAVPVGSPVPPRLDMGKIVTPREPAAGETVHYRLLVENEADTSSYNLVVWDNLDLGPGCLDLNSVANLRCSDCTTLDYDPAMGDLLATKDELPGTNDPGNNFLLIEFDATVVSGAQVCTNTAYVAANGQPAAEASAAFYPYTSSPVLDLFKVVDPTRPGPGGTVSYAIILENEGNADADMVIISDNLDLGPQCLDLSSVTNLQCPRCDTIDYDPATGNLWGVKSTLPGSAVPGGNRVYITFDATALSDTVDCANTSKAAATNHPEVEATASFGPSDQPLSFRRFKLASTTGNDLSWVFPLPPFMTPPPVLPWTDEPGSLGDLTYPLVFYQRDDVGRIFLLSKWSTNTILVCSPETCP
jgi:uncharacterized repeat protein (TIGR01451 family)